MSEKVRIVNELVAEGYCIFDKTPEEFARPYTAEMLEIFLESYRKYKSGQKN